MLSAGEVRNFFETSPKSMGVFDCMFQVKTLSKPFCEGKRVLILESSEFPMNYL